MLETSTNFACLMDLLDVKSVELCRHTGVDKTLVSRWRSGKRKLAPEGRWIQGIASFFIEADKKHQGRLLLEILCAYYPTQSFDTQEEIKCVLIRWLSEEGWKEQGFQKDNAGILGRLKKIIESLAAPEKEATTQSFPTNTAVYGLKGVQGTVLMCAEFVLKKKEPQEILFVCPEGLDMFTRDQKFGDMLMDMLIKLFEAGHKMSVVLRTDYKISDVSLFSGRWLVAHLLGYIKSYYFDDFKSSHCDKMYAVVQDMFVYHVFDETGKVVTTVNFDRESIDIAYERCAIYIKKSKQRFHYSLFEHPDGFLRDVHPQSDRPCYIFSRFPYFGLADNKTFQENFLLSDEEVYLLSIEFPLMLWDVGQFDADVSARYIFCENNIEEALLKQRHVSLELSAITGRRVNMTTQKLVEQLVRIKALLKDHKNLEVCFLPNEAFEKLSMQIMVYADRVAIGWVAGGKSTACRDYTNVNALFGFCDALWDKIPAIARSRWAAKKKLDMWLEKARRYGMQCH